MNSTNSLLIENDFRLRPAEIARILNPDSRHAWVDLSVAADNHMVYVLDSETWAEHLLSETTSI